MKESLSRARKILESDRFGFVSGSKEVIRSDIEAVLKEYFYLPTHIEIKLEAKGERFDLTITANECMLRNFNLLK